MARATSIAWRIAPPRFLMFLALLAGGLVLAIPAWGAARGTMVAFDVAALAFLGSCIFLLNDEADTMRKTAQQQDANRGVLLGLSVILTLVILAAVGGQLSAAKSLGGLQIALVLATLMLAWTFANAVYALHYAHLFYTSADGGKDLAGLEFPGKRPEPDYADFVYFAFTLGVALQTSDICITSPHIRRIVTLHCVAAFVFNLGVLGLTINILSG
jgi:uncharacterized membrane protein